MMNLSELFLIIALVLFYLFATGMMIYFCRELKKDIGAIGHTIGIIATWCFITALYLEILGL